jgi:RNA polymerase sigma-70 factor (ECF subfamily)
LPENRDEEASDAPDPEQEVTERERRDKVRAVLATLPPDQSEVVTLSYVEGLSHSEIADRLGLPLGTVKSRMRLAYQKVKEAVEDIR